jgi:hypothetical protein
LGESGLQVIDISNPPSPVKVGTIDTPGSAIEVAVSGGYAYAADQHVCFRDLPFLRRLQKGVGNKGTRIRLMVFPPALTSSSKLVI